MRALSVKQPYAELIARGEKTREYRRQNLKHRGPLLIVASKTPEGGAFAGTGISPKSVVYGHAVCVVDVVDVEEEDGQFAYVLANPRRVAPTPVSGSIAIFHVDDALAVPSGATSQVLPAPPPAGSQRALPRQASPPRETPQITPQPEPFPTLGEAAHPTAMHARFWAEELGRRAPLEDVVGLTRALGDARVDLNPHQIDAAIFALRSPLSKGVLLADEVGLGKTIEAGLVLAQRWAERKRRILLVVPATLRKQWQNELLEKFYLPSQVVDAQALRRLEKESPEDPFNQERYIVIVSHELVARHAARLAKTEWNLVVVDEAHRLRGLWTDSKRALAVLEAIGAAQQKLLLTATPLQNRIEELWALVHFVDSHLFGPIDTFTAQYGKGDDKALEELRERLVVVVKRTLRKEVLDFIRYTKRTAQTYTFEPSAAEIELYDRVSAYLQRKDSLALPSGQRQLLVMILRKLLASSSRAIGATLAKFERRLRAQVPDPQALLADAAENFETAEEDAEELEVFEEAAETPATLASSGARAEADELSAFIRLAESIPEDAKAGALLTALPELFAIAEQRGALRKVVIFTESRKTQEYLQRLLEAKGYAGKLVLMNGENKDPISKATLAAWKARHAENFAAVTSKNPQADMKAAIVEAFREDAEILLATESAAEGINLQFCSVVINYDLPWNPQRIEQRIGRCHRYGQKSDVLVVNFASTTNAADARVLELLDQKFNLFNGVFGASDSVLGLVESGVNLAKRITDILQTFRTPDEINAEFAKLQDEVGDKIAKAKDDARQKVLEHFDADVARTLQVTHTDARLRLAEGQRMLLGLAEVELGDLLEVEDVSFRVRSGEFVGGYHLDWKQAEEGGLVHFRPGHALAEKLVQEVRARPPTSGVLELEHSPQVSALGVLRGRDDVLVALERYEVTTLGRLEGHVIVALLVSGEALPPEVARKVFELGGRFAADAEPQPVPAALVRAMTSRAMELGADAERRATVHYESQVKQIDRQLDDVRNTIQLEIDELSRAIKEVQRRREKALTLDERLVCDGEQKELQKKRKQRERERFDRQDELDEQRNTLVDALRDKKDDRKVERTPIGWARVRVCG